MADKMTIDDVIVGLRAGTVKAEEERNDNRAAGVRWAIQYILEHRDALETGMRGTLRFRRCAEYGEVWWELKGSKMPYHRCLVFDYKSQCERFAKSIGLEFVEDKE